MGDNFESGNSDYDEEEETKMIEQMRAKSKAN